MTVGNHLDAPLKLSTQIELPLEHQPRPFSALLLDECFDLCMLGSKQLVAPQLLFNTSPNARARANGGWSS